MRIKNIISLILKLPPNNIFTQPCRQIVSEQMEDFRRHLAPPVRYVITASTRPLAATVNFALFTA